MKGAFRIPFYQGGGSSPDPAVFCPAHGYIDPTDPDSGYITNPINPDDGWVLLATFQTNSNAATTFDPTIVTTSGQFAWDLGDGTIIKYDNAISHTYADGTTKTVKLYGKATPIITQIDFSSDNLVGVIDFSNLVFSNSAVIALYTNAAMTGVILPAQLEDVTVKSFTCYSSGITGVLDLTHIKKLDNLFTLNTQYCNTMTGILLSNSITGGSVNQIYISSCALLAGNIDVSGFTNFGANSYLDITSNPYVTSITTAAATSGSLRTLSINNNARLTGLDISGYTNIDMTDARIYINNCPLLTSLQMPTTPVTGKVSSFQMHALPKVAGVLDLSQYGSLHQNCQLTAYGNTLMTGISFASSYTENSAIGELSIHSSNFTGVLDLSVFTAFGTLHQVNAYSNPNLTEIRYASALTGTLYSFNAYSCNLTGTLNLSMWGTITNGLIFKVYSNPNLTGLTFASTVTGTIKTIYAYSCNLTGTLNLSMFKTYIASADIQLNSNPNLTTVNFTSTTITAGTIRTLNLYNCPSLGYVDISKLSINVANAFWNFSDNGWSSAIVNQMLVAINTLASAGFSSRSLWLKGTDYPCDSTSGGYDGTTAKTALQGKSFTVQTVILPTMGATTGASAITQNSANSGGSISGDGNGFISEKGVCYSTSAAPTIADSRTSNGTGTGSFTSAISGLNPATKYYVRDYATNTAGTGYGTEINFTTLP